VGDRATLYSGDERIGGRILSIDNLMAPGLTTEMGAEFIDSDHSDMLGLATGFGLELLDGKAEDNSHLREGYFLAGCTIPKIRSSRSSGVWCRGSSRTAPGSNSP
jgi:monoamine oxidase